MRKRSKSIIGAIGVIITPILFVWGVPGMLDDLDTWSKWVGPNLTIVISFIPALVGLVVLALTNWTWLHRKIIHASEDRERRRQVVADGRVLEARLAKHLYGSIKHLDQMAPNRWRLFIQLTCAEFEEYNRIRRYLGPFEIEIKEGDPAIQFVVLWLEKLHAEIDALEDRWGLSIRD